MTHGSPLKPVVMEKEKYSDAGMKTDCICVKLFIGS